MEKLKSVLLNSTEENLSLPIWFILVDIELHDKTEDRDPKSEDRITWQNKTKV